MNDEIKVGIIGAGLIGCYIGAQLLRTHPHVHFLGRERVGARLKENGLGIDGDILHSPETLHWCTDVNDLPLLDVVIFTTKSQDTEHAAREVLPKVKPGALILSLQNGLKNKETLKLIFPAFKVLSGMVPYNIVQIDATAHFRQATKGHVYLEAADDERLGLFAPPYFELTDRIEDIQWGKLLKNLNNALNALSDKPLLHQLKNRQERRALALVIEEAISVIKKSGHHPKNTGALPVGLAPFVLKLPDRLAQVILKREVKADPTARLSMWQDLQLKRPTEISFLNGEIVAQAEKLGMDAPLNEKVVSLIRLAEKGHLEAARSQYRVWIESL